MRADSVRMDLWTFCEMGCQLWAYGCSFSQLGKFLLIYYLLILTGLPKDWYVGSLICKYTTIYLLTKGPHDLWCWDNLIQSSRLLILTAFLSLLYHRSFSILFTHCLTPENQEWFINTIPHLRQGYVQFSYIGKILDLGRHCALPAWFLCRW